MPIVMPACASAVEYHRKNGIQFVQYMDLDTDRAYYRRIEAGEIGEILMEVDSSGCAFNQHGEEIGRFRILVGDGWAFSHKDGRPDIEHWSSDLYERVEPYVVALLFGSTE